MDSTKALRDWNKCVMMAKKSLGYPIDSFVIVKGRVLKKAMEFYYNLGY